MEETKGILDFGFWIGDCRHVKNHEFGAQEAEPKIANQKIENVMEVCHAKSKAWK